MTFGGFSKLGVAFGSPQKKGYTLLGLHSGSPILGKYHFLKPKDMSYLRLAQVVSGSLWPAPPRRRKPVEALQICDPASLTIEELGTLVKIIIFSVPEDYTTQKVKIISIYPSVTTFIVIVVSNHTICYYHKKEEFSLFSFPI